MIRNKARCWLESWCGVEMCLDEKLGKNFRMSIVGQVQSFMAWWEKQQSYPQPPCSTAYVCYSCCEKHSPLCQTIGRMHSNATRLSEKEAKRRDVRVGKTRLNNNATRLLPCA